MKPILVIFFGLLFYQTRAQEICLRGGKTILPASYISLRFIPPSNNNFRVSFSTSFEKSHRHHLQYSALGFEMMGELQSDKNRFKDQSFGVSSSLGLSWQVEREPWLYKDWPLSKRSSFGLAGEINGYWYLSEAFTLNSFLQQKMLFNPLLGRYRLMGGLGIHYRLGSY